MSSSDDRSVGSRAGRVPSRRRFLGGALAATLAAALLPADRLVTPKPRWEIGKTRWIGHW